MAFEAVNCHHCYQLTKYHVDTGPSTMGQKSGIAFVEMEGYPIPVNAGA